MPNITRTFPLEQLKEWDVPHADDTAIEVVNEWCVFRAPDDGLVYRLYFSPVFPEYAEMDWFDDLPASIPCERVEQHQRTVVIDEWLPVAASPAVADA